MLDLWVYHSYTLITWQELVSTLDLDPLAFNN